MRRCEFCVMQKFFLRIFMDVEQMLLLILLVFAMFIFLCARKFVSCVFKSPSISVSLQHVVNNSWDDWTPISECCHPTNPC